MLRWLRLIFLIVLAIVLVTVAFANREPVVLRALPPDMALFFGADLLIQLPLFLVIFGGIVAGLAIGFVWEWVREGKHRAAATQHRRTAQSLEREVSRLREKEAVPQDEIIALLEGKSGAR